ncbi:UDP-2,3-diacylglucosamine diphosphatase [Piscinibacter sp.]|uniref:UDP-2,3-diacylglucosamine diphosphatase n=1 Tax=Piscinibacter sp. TaxID=1903157 RepID=UPI002C8E431C|nr:UDP-2,3-diacylglucosamine diphosphatase [Albitalea sp.]HUG21209.1 UDP-2,3-diacylglucosamine diphosphatase [Albitalea sp.]
MAETVAAALPTFAEFRAPPSWRAIEFLSDLHLSEATPRTFESLATHLRCTSADAVFILGDLFEVWVGDDARHAGFEAECAAMLADASSRRFIAFMAGNRDFLVGAELLDHCGVHHLADPTVLLAFDQRLLLTHGDALCLSDVAYQRFRAEVRGMAWQRAFLAQSLAERREAARRIRAESRHLKTMQRPGEWFDVDAAEAARWMRAARAPVMVHGHTHAPATHELAPGLVRHVLSDWDFDPPGAAARGDVLRWQRDGLARMPPAPAHSPC